jgi:hypothetical protein
MDPLQVEELHSGVTAAGWVSKANVSSGRASGEQQGTARREERGDGGAPIVCVSIWVGTVLARTPNTCNCPALTVLLLCQP